MKTFKFQLEVEATPYASDTIEELFGKGATFIPYYPEHMMASELIGELLKDAICAVLDMQMDFITKHPKDMDNLGSADAVFWRHLKAKEELYHKIEKSLKHIP